MPHTKNARLASEPTFVFLTRRKCVSAQIKTHARANNLSLSLSLSLSLCAHDQCMCVQVRACVCVCVCAYVAAVHVVS
jgi:hypothetical protein